MRLFFKYFIYFYIKSFKKYTRKELTIETKTINLNILWRLKKYIYYYFFIIKTKNIHNPTLKVHSYLKRCSMMINLAKNIKNRN